MNSPSKPLDLQRRRLRFALIAGWFIFWALMMAVEIQDYLRDGGKHLWEPVLWQGSSCLVATFLMTLQQIFQWHKRYSVTQPWRWFWAHLRWLPVLSAGCISAMFALRHLGYYLMDATYRHQPWSEIYVYETVKLALYFSMFITIWFGILSYKNMLEQTERAEKSGAQVRQVQLQRLTAQMQPHFLFNALNTISSLMHVDVARADATLSQLSEMLRATLDLGEQSETTLERELQLLRSYASLMGERFSDRVAIRWEIDEKALDCKVPVMSLQPLLENVFKHTVEKRSGTTAILVSARRDDARLVLRVEDDSGRLAAGASSGLGLRNLRERLATLHGDTAGLQLSQLEPFGVRAEMVLPCAS